MRSFGGKEIESRHLHLGTVVPTRYNVANCSDNYELPFKFNSFSESPLAPGLLILFVLIFLVGATSLLAGSLCMFHTLNQVASLCSAVCWASELSRCLKCILCGSNEWTCLLWPRTTTWSCCRAFHLKVSMSCNKATVAFSLIFLTTETTPNQ